MIKIILLVTKDDVGGAQKYVKDLKENLDLSRFELKILTGGRTGARFLSNSLLPHFLFINDLLALGELLFFFWKEKPDIVHLNSSKAGVIGAIAARLAGVKKIIFTAHGWVFNPNNKLNSLKRHFYIWLHKIAARFQDVIINVSEYDKQLAINHKIAPFEKLVTIYNGIAPINFLGKIEARRELLKKFKIACLPVGKENLKLKIDGIWIGSVGRLVTEKDYITFLESAALLPNVNFFIIGSGPLKKNLESRIQNLGLGDRFFILENIAPAAPYLKAFDIFLLTSIKEGLPYTMLEAMAAEIPLVVTRVGGMTEIIEGRGLVMPPKEPQELARAVSYLLEHPQDARDFAAKANNFLKEKLNLLTMIKKTEEIYKS